MRFQFARQRNQMDCGPTCLYMVCRHYGRTFNLERLRQLTEIGKGGVSLLGISIAAERVGLRVMAVQLSTKTLIQDAQKPCILHWQQNHFVVLYKSRSNHVYIADPAAGLLKLNLQELEAKWCSNAAEKKGIVLLLEPSPDFYSNGDEEAEQQNKTSFKNILVYVSPFKKLLIQLGAGLLLGSIFQLILPFLTQSIVDTGVNTGNIHFVQVILFAQLALFAGRLTVEFIRGWILYHISSRINISILTDFIARLMKLPMEFFDSKRTGDIMQRMNDHHRIQNFLTGTSLGTIFSLFNLAVFSIVLGTYSLQIFTVFLTASMLYGLWIILFLKKRRQLDYKQFSLSAEEQGMTIQIVQGMQEIKLHGCELQKRWDWERLQARLFRLGIKGVGLNQWQQCGAFFINEGKNIVITFLSAHAVINGQMTLGGMLAIQYIAGQLNGPVEQLISFVQSWQLAKISLERLNEIHSIKEEEASDSDSPVHWEGDDSLRLQDLSFTYPGAGNEPVLKNINLVIPAGKTTAIVGTSGSGKTTLVKLLLRFYNIQHGTIQKGSTDLQHIPHSQWRRQIGTVMQESFIFSESVVSNIALGDNTPDPTRLRNAARMARILDFIEQLPLGFDTKIGAEGNGISAGQKQRILIARAMYKNPRYIFLDEATNSLDASNESALLKNLSSFLENRTAVIVAHRLSTVKNADQIVVLSNGSIAECGTHKELIGNKGAYFKLVKDQLELGE